MFDDIDACLTQLNHISDRRHRLVHRSSTFFDGKLLVSNAMTARTVTGAQSDVFDIPELRAMTSDCEVIWIRLIWRCEIKISHKLQPSLDVNDKLREYAITRPWKYKHAPPKPPNQRPRKAPESPKPQPDASRVKPGG
jgi:hypothetical protein